MRKLIGVYLSFVIFQLSTMFSINSVRVVMVPVALTVVQERSFASDNVKNVNETQSNRMNKSKLITLLLAWFIGLHHFYLGNYTTGVIYLVSGFIGIGAILSLIDFITFLGMNDIEWKNYLKSNKAVPWL